MKALTQAIFAKCAVGTSLHTAIGGRLFKGRAPSSAAYPFIVYEVISDVPTDTFTEHIEEVMIQFSIFSSNRQSADEVEDLFGYLKTLYDNCELTISGYTHILMTRGNASLMSEEVTTKSGTEEIWHYAVEYTVVMQKN